MRTFDDTTDRDYRLAGIRVHLALLNLQIIAVKAGFREDQPRDERGRWNGGGGSVIVTRKDRTGDAKIDRTTDELVDIVKDVVARVGPGQGPLYGTRIHAEAARTLRQLDLPGIGVHGVEQSFSLTDTARYGLNGSVRTDIVLRDGRTEASPIRAIWDIKTGTAGLNSRRVRELRQGLGVDETVPVIEIHIDDGVNVKSRRP